MPWNYYLTYLFKKSKKLQWRLWGKLNNSLNGHNFGCGRDRIVIFGCMVFGDNKSNNVIQIYPGLFLVANWWQTLSYLKCHKVKWAFTNWVYQCFQPLDGSRWCYSTTAVFICYQFIWLSQNNSNYKTPVLQALSLCNSCLNHLPNLNLSLHLHGKTVDSQY